MPEAIQPVSIRVKINGVARERQVEPRMLLVDFIREELDLTGTHVGCESTYCGACTVLLNGENVKSCTLFAFQADGGELLTVEGLARDGKLHPLQQAFSDCHGLQCGYCTPGLLMTAHNLLSRNPDPSVEQIRKAIAGNVCRCTGYQNVVKSIRSAARLMREAEEVKG